MRSSQRAAPSLPLQWRVCDLWPWYTDERSAQRHDVFRAFAVEHGEITRWQQSFEAIAESEHFPTKFVGRERGTAQDGIEPGAIAAAGKDADPRFHPRRDYSIFFGST